MGDCAGTSDNRTIILWTFQPFDAVMSAWDSGKPYRCVPSLSSYGGETNDQERLDEHGSRNEESDGEADSQCSEQFRICYRWIADAMDRYGIDRPNGVDDGAYPVWAWARWTDNAGKERTKPDLRYMAFNRERLIAGNALFSFEMNRSDILLSDFDLWHLPLNGLPIDDAIDESIESVYDGNESDMRSAVETWDRCIVPSDATLADMPEWTQACIWELREADCRYAKRLN